MHLMESIERRETIVKQYADDIKREFPQTGKYNVLIFGSFLTDQYTEESDIDIGIFSLEPGLTFRIYNFTKDYFEEMGIPNDVVRMRLSHSQYINLAIITNNTYTVTDYCPEELIQYTKEMLELYGVNPQEKLLKDLRQEVVSIDSFQ